MRNMEHSSPLAAMQPPAPLIFGRCFRSEAAGSYSMVPPARKLGAESFNFKELSMSRFHADYFSAKPVGSSPTASLAADLSQNFHIDQSPQLVTPRRSLFSANLFGSENGRAESMTTPPLPSSSPAGTFDVMDMSPLPHKTPFAADIDLDMESPTADISMAKSQLQSRISFRNSPGSGQPERRRPPILRPCLMRAKALSANLQNSSVPQPSPFQFAAGRDVTQGSPSLSLSEMFEHSPSQEKISAAVATLGSGSSMGPPRPRPLSGVVSQPQGNGSPPGRKCGNPYARPRKLSRRSLSMFEHPEDVLKGDEDSGLASSPIIQSVADIDTVPQLHLPHFISEDQPDCLPRINNSVLVDVINGKYNDRYDRTMIIDCRFEYEYEGGHINGAINFNDKDALAVNLFDKEYVPKTVLVFHCEYSAHRAPIMAKFIRHRDRAVNIDHYPRLSYPEMYILHGGYSAFFTQHRALCFPQNYVEMSAKEHEFACERGLGKVKQRSKLSRAQTFAFGQDSSRMEDSPTGRLRPNGDGVLGLDGTSDGPSEPGRPVPGRRMFTA